MNEKTLKPKNLLLLLFLNLKKNQQKKDDGLKTVNGVVKPFPELAEDDEELMTDDDYTMYFEMYAAKNV